MSLAFIRDWRAVLTIWPTRILELYMSIAILIPLYPSDHLLVSFIFFAQLFISLKIMVRIVRWMGDIVMVLDGNFMAKMSYFWQFSAPCLRGLLCMEAGGGRP